MIKIEINKGACAVLGVVWFFIAFIVTFVVAEHYKAVHHVSQVPDRMSELLILLWFGPYLLAGIAWVLALFRPRHVKLASPIKITRLPRCADPERQAMVKEYEAEADRDG